MTSGFLGSNAGHTVRRLRLLCQKTSHHFVRRRSRLAEGARTIGIADSVRLGPSTVWVITTTESPILTNSSASRALTVSIPPKLGAKACDEIRMFKAWKFSFGKVRLSPATRKVIAHG